MNRNRIETVYCFNSHKSWTITVGDVVSLSETGLDGHWLVLRFTSRGKFVKLASLHDDGDAFYAKTLDCHRDEFMTTIGKIYHGKQRT